MPCHSWLRGKSLSSCTLVKISDLCSYSLTPWHMPSSSTWALIDLVTLENWHNYQGPDSNDYNYNDSKTQSCSGHIFTNFLIVVTSQHRRYRYFHCPWTLIIMCKWWSGESGLQPTGHPALSNHHWSFLRTHSSFLTHQEDLLVMTESCVYLWRCVNGHLCVVVAGWGTAEGWGNHKDIAVSKVSRLQRLVGSC